MVGLQQERDRVGLLKASGSDTRICELTSEGLKTSGTPTGVPPLGFRLGPQLLSLPGGASTALLLHALPWLSFGGE